MLTTCVYVGLFEKQRQTLYFIKRIKVMDSLMKSINAILMLETTRETHLNNSPRFNERHLQVCASHLWQAGEDGGAAG